MADEVKPAAAAATPAASEGEGAVEKRIAQLTRQKHDATRRADSAEAKTADLTNRLVELQSTVNELSARPAPVAQPAPTIDPMAALLGSPAKDQTVQPAGQPVDLAGLIKAAVGEALAPMVAGQAEAAEADALRIAQARSYQETAKELCPQALVAGSVEQSTFDAIFQSSPGLMADADGPAIALAAVAGIVGNGVRSTSVQEAKKQAASLPDAASNILARLGSLPSDTTKAAGAIDALGKKGSSEGLESNELAALIHLQMGAQTKTEE